MKMKNEQSTAKIYQFPATPSARGQSVLSDSTADRPVTPLRNPQIVFGAWYHQAEIEKDAPTRRH